jgi:predicted acetyltransferase
VTSELDLRTCTPDDLPALAELITGAFLGDVEAEMLDVYNKVYEPERIHVITDAGRMVATGGIYTRDLTVPGAAIPVAHVTGVAVASTHRRRGLLTGIMNAQLAAVRERGDEPVAALWASEGAIYGRFGYGAAAWRVEYTIPVRETNLPGETPPGRLRSAVPADSIAVLTDVYERVRVTRPGLSGRPDRWWERLTADPKARRNGMSSWRAVIYEVDGRVDGYATWRAKGGWGDTSPIGEVQVGEVVATTVDAYAALWRFLLNIDLVRTVRYSFAAVDEPLPHLVTNPTGIGGLVGPSLWVRVVDVPAALAARKYAVPVDVVLEVSDAMFAENAGRWHLVGDGSSAKCVATDADPQLSLDIQTLGAAYLGGTSLQALSDAGRVTEREPGSLTAVSTAFGWHRAPAAIEIF